MFGDFFWLLVKKNFGEKNYIFYGQFFFVKMFFLVIYFGKSGGKKIIGKKKFFGH